MIPRRAGNRSAAVRCTMLLAAAVLLSMGRLAAAEDIAPQSMPPHPDLLRRIQAEGYDSVTVVDLRQAAEQRRLQGVDMPEPVLAPVTGTRPALVLLVDFSDYAHNAVSTPTLYSNLLFSVDTYPAPGSMRDFYRRASYGLYDIWPSLVDSWRVASQNHTYYANHDGITGTADDYGMRDTYPYNAQKLVEEAVNLAHAGGVNFATYAVGGQVQGLFVIHAGPGGEADYTGTHPDWIWSHKWSLHAPVTLDGVVLSTYSIEPEYVFSPGDSTIGVFAHEYGHVIGLPDLYDTDYSSAGLGDWSLMAGGSWNGPYPGGGWPAFPDAFCRSLLGWVTPQVPTSTVTGATMPAVESSPTVYQLWTNGSVGTEYFLLENRQKTDFDQYLPGSGLLLYHVDESVPLYDGNDNEWHPLVMLEQADGFWDLQSDPYSRGDAGDPFPGSSNVRSTTADTIPGTRSYANADTKVAITGISDSAATMTANLSVQYTSVPPRFEDKGTTMSLPNTNCSAWGDYDSDGYPDLYIGASWGEHRCTLLHNNGNGTFTDVTVARGLRTESQYWEDDGAAWGDFNNDGRLDLIVTGGNHNPLLYRNDGDHFTEIGGPAAGFSDQTVTHESARSVAWDDYDGDNWLDVYITYIYSSISRLYHNNRDGTFTEVNSAAGMDVAPAGQAIVLGWADYNNDGANDLLVGRPRTDVGADQPVRLYRNDGDDTFTDVAAAAGIAGLADSPGDVKGVAWGDFNNDGNVDLFLAPGHTRAPWLFRNNGNGTFSDITGITGMSSPGLIGYGAAWGDYDNDGHVDLLALPGEATAYPLLWRNNGNGTFSESHDPEGLSAARDFRSAGWADYDRDGKLDFVATSNAALIGYTCLYHNMGRATDGNYLRVRALTDADGDATDANTSDDRDAIGARVDVSLNNDAAFAPFSTMVRFIDGGSGWMGQNEQAAHFGLGAATTVAVRVTFPDGNAVIKKSVPANGEFVVREGSAVGGILTGTVTDVGSGLPVAAAAVECVGVGTTTTNIVGRFLMPEVPTGTYTVNVSATGYVPATTASVQVLGGATTTVNFALQRNIGAIAGVVTDARTAAPVPGALVTCGVFSATTAGDGSYLITQVPVGTAYTVSATASGYQGATSSGISVSLGATTTVNLTLNPLLGAISGTVRDAAIRLPIASATVSAAGQTATTDQEGRYGFANVRVGSYTVTASAANHAGASQPSVTVLLNQTTVVNFDLTASATGSVSGTVRDAASQSPIQSATVTCGALSAKTDASGAYTLPGVPVGTYAVGAAAGGYRWMTASGVAVASGQKTTQDFALTRLPTTSGAQFEDIAPELSIAGALGAAWGDYDGDGYPDLFLAGATGPSGHGPLLLHNNRDLTFSDVSGTVGLPSTQEEEDGAAWGDYDSDGKLDLIIAAGSGSVKLYRNGGSFTDVAPAAGLGVANGPGRGVAWCDYDGDGLLDVFICNTMGSISRLMRNNGDGTFTDVTTTAGMTGAASPTSGNAAAWGDYDNDGQPDLLLSRMGARPLLYHNNGNGTFTEVGFAAGVSVASDTFGVAWGDYDNDGYLDCYLASAQGMRDWLFHNDHLGTFTDVAATAGMAGDTQVNSGAAWADYDNDGFLDLFVGNGAGEPLLYHNSGDGNFTEVAGPSGVVGGHPYGTAIWADIDLDGKMDLFSGVGGPLSALFHNIGEAGNWLRVRALTSATGDATDASKPSRDAIGVRVELNVDNDDNFLPGRTLVRVIDGGSSFCGQNEQIAQFGIPTDGPVAVRVLFPDGSAVVHRDVGVNQQIVIKDVPAARTREFFSDIPLDYWAYLYIEAVVDASVAAGYSDGTYRPTLAVTRDQMAVYISRALAGGDSKVPTPIGAASFPDVASGYWAFKYVEYAKSSKVVTGYPDGTYQPTVALDRGQMAVFIARSIATPTGDEGVDNFTLPTTASFSDVPTSFWAFKYVEYIKSKSVTSGYPDGLYHPEYICTRDQMAVYIARAFGLGS